MDSHKLTLLQVVSSWHMNIIVFVIFNFEVIFNEL